MALTLFTAPRSPFARKVRMFVREAGLTAEIAEQTAVLRGAGNVTLGHGPTGRVPALLVEGGRMILESQVICRYLEDRFGPTGLHPADPPAREADLELDGIGSELMEAVSWRARELRFRADGERSPGVVAYEAGRCRRIYDWLEGAAALDGPPTVGRISAAAGLATANYFTAEDDWRTGRPRLAAWFGGWAARPSLTDTAPPATLPPY